MLPSPVLDVRFHKRQADAYHSKATEILYGGAAGGGKSWFLRVIAVLFCCEIPGLQVYLFRRISDDLVKNHIEGPKGLRALLAPFVLCGFVTIVEDQIRFWNGSKIYLCHCKDEKDRWKYLGAEIHLLLVDELTTFTETIYRFLRSRVRAVGLNVPEKYRGMFPRIICGSNPGNVGHLFVKKTFVSARAPMEAWQTPDTEGGMIRQYIPARLADNPSMTEDDPTYRARLRGLGKPSLVKAMEEGDWNIIEGAFFENWSEEKHVIEPFEIPPEWTCYPSGDWGSAKPFSFGVWHLVPEWFCTPQKIWLPRGALVRTREWYGVRKDENGETQADVGLKLDAEEVGRQLFDRWGHIPNMGIGVIDPSTFSNHGGPSIAERLMGPSGSNWKITFRPGDNNRLPYKGALGGWDQMRSRLNGEDFGDPYGARPMMYYFNTCIDSIRTIPVLQHDTDRPEDINTESEDHAGDDSRYAVMARPYLKKPVVSETPKTIQVGGASTVTMDNLWKDREGDKENRV